MVEPDLFNTMRNKIIQDDIDRKEAERNEHEFSNTLPFEATQAILADKQSLSPEDRLIALNRYPRTAIPMSQEIQSRFDLPAAVQPKVQSQAIEAPSTFWKATTKDGNVYKGKGEEIPADVKNLLGIKQSEGGYATGAIEDKPLHKWKVERKDGTVIEGTSRFVPSDISADASKIYMKGLPSKGSNKGSSGQEELTELLKNTKIKLSQAPAFINYLEQSQNRKLAIEEGRQKAKDMDLDRTLKIFSAREDQLYKSLHNVTVTGLQKILKKYDVKLENILPGSAGEKERQKTILERSKAESKYLEENKELINSLRNDLSKTNSIISEFTKKQVEGLK